MIALVGLFLCFLIFIWAIVNRKIILVLFSPIMAYVFLSCLMVFSMSSVNCISCDMSSAEQWRIFGSQVGALMGIVALLTLTFYLLKVEPVKEIV